MRKGHVSEKTDGFALGVVIVELLTYLDPTKARDLVDDHTVNTLAAALRDSSLQQLQQLQQQQQQQQQEEAEKAVAAKDTKKGVSLVAEMAEMAAAAVGPTAADSATVALTELAAVAVSLTLARPRSAPADVLPALEKAHAALLDESGAPPCNARSEYALLEHTSPPFKPGSGSAR
jgi:hypothetical protein